MYAEVFILGLVVLLHGGAWLFDKWRAWRWERSNRGKEAAHVQALAAQLLAAREWEQSQSISPLNMLSGSKPRQK